VIKFIPQYAQILTGISQLVGWSVGEGEHESSVAESVYRTPHSESKHLFTRRCRIDHCTHGTRATTEREETCCAKHASVRRHSIKVENTKSPGSQYLHEVTMGCCIPNHQMCVNLVINPSCMHAAFSHANIHHCSSTRNVVTALRHYGSGRHVSARRFFVSLSSLVCSHNTSFTGCIHHSQLAS